MAVPTVITDLSATAASNSPTGADSPIDGDNFIRALSAFIRQNYDDITANSADLADASDTAKGDALVGVKRTETNATGRTLHFYVQHSKLKVANYCDPTSDTATQVATALANAITDAKAGGKALEFETATYTTDAEVAFLGASGLRGFRFWGNGCTIYRNTGSGPVATLDSSASSLRCDNIEFLDFTLRGQASTTYGLYTRGLTRSKVRALAYDIATAGFKTDWSVLTDHDFIVSDNIHTFAVNPATGLIVDRAGVGEYCAANKFHVIMEGPITGIGVDLVYAGLNNIFTGSCENIASGLRQQSTAADTVLLGMDFEGNSVYDVLAQGTGLSLIDTECSSAGSSGSLIIDSTAASVAVTGGFYRQIAVDASAAGTTINRANVSDNGSLGITGSGSWKGTGNKKLDTSRVITSLVTDTIGDTSTWTPTVSQGVSITGLTITKNNYRINGRHVNIRAKIVCGSTGTASTAVVIQGIPSALALLSDDVEMPAGRFIFYDTSTGTYYTGSCVSSSTTAFVLQTSGVVGAFGVTPAITIGSGDVIYLYFDYEIA